jgi:hypothetical protein
VLSVLQAGWRRSGITFPTGFEVLLFHMAQGPMLRTCHAGLVFPRGSEFTYIEKTCGAGHFVRLDVSEKTDIYQWLWGVHSGTNTAERTFVTINDRITELREAPPPNQTNANKPSRN